MSKFDELKKLAEAATQEKWELYHGNIAHDIDRDGAQIIAQRPARSGGGLQKKFDANFSFIIAAQPHSVLELLAIQAQLVAALKQALETIDDYLTYEHNGDPWTEDARTMGEMDINDYANDGRQAKAIGALALAGEQP